MKTILFFISLFFMISCSSDMPQSKYLRDNRVDSQKLNVPETSEREEHLERIPTSTTVSSKKDPLVNQIPRRVIKNADLRLQVKNVDKSTVVITALTNDFQGFIANMDLTNDNHEISNKIQVRIPAGSFEAFLNELSKEAIFVFHKRVNTQDVTSEYVDLQSRLKTKKEVKEKYAEILRSKTKTVDELFNAEEMIRKLQEEIEAAEGRLRYLSNQSSLSTVLVDIYEPKEYDVEPVVYTESFWIKLWEGFENGWSSVTSVILFLVNIWPTLFLVIFIFWKRKSLFKRLMNLFSKKEKRTV